MRRNDAEIFKMFQSGLKFLEDGGYRRSLRTLWQAAYILEDSPTCLNFGEPSRPQPCRDCPLIEFVPALFRRESAPCRFIPLIETRETSYDFYQSGTQMELEEALACWLRKQIQRMAKQQTNANTKERRPPPCEAAKLENPPNLIGSKSVVEAAQRVEK